MVAGFLEMGVEPHRVYRELNERHSHQGIRLLAEALLRIQFGVEGRLAWVKLPASLLADCGAEEEDTADVINHILSIEGVEIGLLFRETGDGGTKISMRSTPQHDVNSLARLHGGGGHKNASGAVVKATLDACEQRLVLEAESLLR